MKHQQIFILNLLMNLISLNCHSFNSLEIAKQFLPDNPIILEAGARFGNDTKKMFYIWPNATIHAFEPHPNSFAQLKHEMLKLKSSNIFIYPIALSNKNGNITLYNCPGNVGASSVSKPTKTIDNVWPFEKTPIEIKCIKLDEWAKDCNIDHIDFMWLDMEGHELTALKSGVKILKTVRALQVEVNYLKLREDMPLYETVRDWLQKQGFLEVWRTITPNKWQGDALFVRHDLVPKNFEQHLVQLVYA